MTLVFEIFSIIANIIYFLVLRMELYTDNAILPSGEETYTYTPIEKLSSAGNTGLVDFQLMFAVVSVILAILLMVGIKNKYIRIAWVISTAASTILFIVILLYAATVRLKY